jgi:hypothetical protein
MSSALVRLLAADQGLRESLVAAMPVPQLDALFQAIAQEMQALDALWDTVSAILFAARGQQDEEIITTPGTPQEMYEQQQDQGVRRERDEDDESMTQLFSDGSAAGQFRGRAAGQYGRSAGQFRGRAAGQFGSAAGQFGSAGGRFARPAGRSAGKRAGRAGGLFGDLGRTLGTAVGAIIPF